MCEHVSSSLLDSVSVAACAAPHSYSSRALYGTKSSPPGFVLPKISTEAGSGRTQLASRTSGSSFSGSYAPTESTSGTAGYNLSRRNSLASSREPGGISVISENEAEDTLSCCCSVLDSPKEPCTTHSASDSNEAIVVKLRPIPDDALVVSDLHNFMLPAAFGAKDIRRNSLPNVHLGVSNGLGGAGFQHQFGGYQRGIARRHVNCIPRSILRPEAEIQRQNSELCSSKAEMITCLSLLQGMSLGDDK